MKKTEFNETKPSMKRRMDNIDYSKPQIYMITMATEERRPLFGRVVPGKEAAARMELSPLGQWVNNEIEHIPRFYPQVRILGKQVMPDHLHFIIHVREPLPVHLGKVVAGFKAGCNRGMQGILSQQNCETRDTPQSTNPHEATPETRSTPRSTSPREAIGKEGAKQGEAGLAQGSVECSASLRQKEKKRDRTHGLLFEPGYHDRVLSGKNQLQRMIDYIHDNPRRLLLRRSAPDWLRPKFGVCVGSYVCSALGNMELLRRPCRAVRISRRSTEEQIQKDIAAFLKEAREGTVLVSPSISPGEKRVMRAAFEARLPLVVLVENGFTEYSKPTGEQFYACAEGRLLLLAPWEHHTDRRPLTAQQCQQLNLLAVEIQNAGERTNRDSQPSF